MTWKRLFILFFVAPQMVSTQLLFSDDVLLDRVRNEAPMAWLSYLRSLDEIEYRVSETITATGTQDEKRSSSGLSIYPNFLSRSSGERGERLSASNAKYHFSLSRKGQNDAWDLLMVNQLPPPDSLLELSFPKLSSSPDVARNRELELREWNQAHLAVALKMNLRIWFPSYFESPDFRILSATEISEGNYNLIRVQYAYEPSQYVPGELLRSGEVFLMPDRLWVIKKALFSVLEPDQITRLESELNLDYDLESTGIPLPTRVTLTAKNPASSGDGFIITWDYQWNRHVQDKRSQQFTLSDYGFPEPDFGERPIGWFRSILTAVCILMITFALWRMYLNR